MRTSLCTVALLVIACALLAGTATPAAATPTPAARETAVATWSPDLATGQAAGIRIDAGIARLDLPSAFPAPDETGAAIAYRPVVPTGLLTLEPRRLDDLTRRVGAVVLGDVPSGGTASVDVRGRRGTGGWTEWVPAVPDADGTAATLPEPTSQVQARLVLTTGTDAVPAVRAVTLTAYRTDRVQPSARHRAERYRVFATREGLVGATTANGHVITERDRFVALPSRRALSPRGTGDYSVRVCVPGGRCAVAPVWDVGPWNTSDDYWNPHRRRWPDLPRGVPQAQAAFLDGHHGGRDQYDRKVTNPAGIDLADGLFRDALGLRDNSWVMVDYLWTGDERGSTVLGDAPVDVLAGPDVTAEVVGTASAMSTVPVECRSGRWLRIGTAQYVDAAAVTHPGPVGECTTPDGTGAG